MVSVMLLVTVLAVGTGIGYSVSRPLLGDGSTYLSRGHTVAHVNGETGKSDAEAAAQLATGDQPVQTVRLPDGRVAIVNKTTGTTTIIDGATMTPTGPPVQNHDGDGQIDALATDSGGYLVDKKGGTISRLAPPGKPASPSVAIQQGIITAVPSGDSVWVLTKTSQVVEVANGHAVRTIRLGAPVTGITVADHHPVAVTDTGRAYVVDADQPHLLGELGVSGSGVVLGSWRGAGRYVLAVDRTSGKVAALDPRTGHAARASLPDSSGEKLDAPVVLGSDVYVPDYSKPQLWRVDATSGEVHHDALRVPGQAGDGFDLTISGGHVWANSQYDRRALIVDGDGHERFADKGAAPDVRDSQSSREPSPLKPRHLSRIPAGPPALRQDGHSGPDERQSKRQPVEAFKTPSVIGLTSQAACRLTRSAQLTCATKADPTPATDPEQFDVVSAQDPNPGGTPADKKVTVTYPNRFTMPDVAGQTQGEACARLRAFKMSCRGTIGVAATGANKPGTVYDQNPKPGTPETKGMAAQVLYYSGTGTTHNYIGQNIDAACAQVQADGFACVRREGTTAAGTGQQPNTVYLQNPVENTKRDIKQPVTLTYYSATNSLPSYTGSDPGAACTDIAARGFTCKQIQQPYAATNSVQAQDQAPGSYPIGTEIAIHYSPWALVDYYIYEHNSLDVWALRPKGTIPAGFGRTAYHVGYGYKVGEAIPTPQLINGFFCTAGGNKCNGMANNHFYSHQVSYADPYWQGPTQMATFMDCSVPGTLHLYRVWKDVGAERHYSITSDPAGWGAEDNESLGCVWP